MDYSPWGGKESDTTEQLTVSPQFVSCSNCHIFLVRIVLAIVGRNEGLVPKKYTRINTLLIRGMLSHFSRV